MPNDGAKPANEALLFPRAQLASRMREAARELDAAHRVENPALAPDDELRRTIVITDRLAVILATLFRSWAAELDKKPTSGPM